MSLPLFTGVMTADRSSNELCPGEDRRGQERTREDRSGRRPSVRPADVLTACLSLLFQAHGLPCPPALDTWKSTVEQRAVDMMCHLYKPNKRFGQHTQLFLFKVNQRVGKFLPHLSQRNFTAVCGTPPAHVAKQHRGEGAGHLARTNQVGPLR